MKTHHEFDVGDEVMVTDGAFSGQHARVVDLNGPKAKILLNFLGAERSIIVNTEGLER